MTHHGMNARAGISAVRRLRSLVVVGVLLLLGGEEAVNATPLAWAADPLVVLRSLDGGVTWSSQLPSTVRRMNDLVLSRIQPEQCVFEPPPYAKVELLGLFG